MAPEDGRRSRGRSVRRDLTVRRPGAADSHPSSAYTVPSARRPAGRRAVFIPHVELVLTTRPLVVHVLRGAAVESTHRVHAVLCLADGSVGARFGDPDAASFWRSALKPFQALPVVEDGAAAAFGFGTPHVAMACASHGGRPEHVEQVRGMLQALSMDETALHCGPHAPYDHDADLAMECAGVRPGRIHNNCSGKHAAMLALAAHRGWSAEGYWRLDHAVQRRVRERLADWIGPDPAALTWATDGCGIPTPLLRLEEMAQAYARLGRAAAAGEPGPAAVVGAMTARPELTSSPGREPLLVMQATGGRLLAKEGAEGVLCVAAPAEGWGLALKIEDGTRRAVGPATLAVLVSAGLLSPDERTRLSGVEEIPVLGTTGERVGAIRAVAGAPEAG